MAQRRHQRTRSGETPNVQPEAVLLPDQWWAEGSDRAYLPTPEVQPSTAGSVKGQCRAGRVVSLHAAAGQVAVPPAASHVLQEPAGVVTRSGPAAMSEPASTAAAQRAQAEVAPGLCDDRPRAHNPAFQDPPLLLGAVVDSEATIRGAPVAAKAAAHSTALGGAAAVVDNAETSGGSSASLASSAPSSPSAMRPWGTRDIWGGTLPQRSHRVILRKLLISQCWRTHAPLWQRVARTAPIEDRSDSVWCLSVRSDVQVLDSCLSSHYLSQTMFLYASYVLQATIWRGTTWRVHPVCWVAGAWCRRCS